MIRRAALIVKAMRPRQWTKNGLLFAGLYLSHNLLNPVAQRRALAGFALFCLISGAVYLLNDIIDVERDRAHPRKRLRPIASGELPIHVALLSFFLAAGGGLIGAWGVSHAFGLCAASYLLLMIPYSLWLKEIFLIDTLAIAMGFIIRAVSGVIVLRTAQRAVPLTSWFVICVMFLALLLAFAKRRSERVKLEGAAGDNFRPVLAMYSVGLMDQVIGISAAGAILSYTLYVTSAAGGAMWSMLTTLPFVLYGIFRYLHLVYSKGEGEAPEVVLTGDLPLLGCVAMWALVLLWANLPGH